MFVVGVQRLTGNWQYVSDGTVAYITSSDFRNPNACAPPALKVWDYLDVVAGRYERSFVISEKEIGCIDLYQELPEVSRTDVRRVIRVTGSTESAKEFAKVMVLDLYMGNAEDIANPRLKTLLSRFTNVLRNTEARTTCAELHQVASALHQTWKKFDLEVESIRTATDGRQRKSWGRFWKLRDLESLDTLSGTDFERAIANLYTILGYETALTKKTGDFGVDLVLIKNPRRYAVQIKRQTANVGIAAVQQVIAGGVLYEASHHVVVTNSLFTSAAKELAHAHSVELIDRNKLATLWSQAYPNSARPTYTSEAFKQIKSEIFSSLSEANATRPRLRKKRARQPRKW
jgi:HJR/Mrr/RecB family endonuclease